MECFNINKLQMNSSPKINLTEKIVDNVNIDNKEVKFIDNGNIDNKEEKFIDSENFDNKEGNEIGIEPEIFNKELTTSIQNIATSFPKMRISDPNLIIDEYYMDRPSLHKVDIIRRKNILGRSGIQFDHSEKVFIFLHL